MTKLLWLDMEMTGLDVEKEVIIEVGVLVTDLKFEVLDQYHAVVKQPQEYIDRMDSWNQKHHRESGLVDLIPTGQEPDKVEADLIALCAKHFAGERVILAGNSIGQDRLFINKYFQKFAAKLHYRMLDVTSFKLIFNSIYSISYAKKESKHRALDDIQDSINELKRYLSFIPLEPQAPSRIV